MDLNTITENIPAALAALAALAAGGWAVFKFVAKLTKTKKDDAIVEKYDETVEKLTGQDDD